MTQTNHIKYKTITHLFWGKFSYKVVVTADPTGSLAGAKASNAYRAFRNIKFQTQLDQHCPIDPNAWRSRLEYFSRSFFFKTADDAQKLINFARDYITEVWQPVSTAHVDALAADHKLVTRDFYYWDKFPWCITFTPQSSRWNSPDRQFISDWVDEAFGDKKSDVDYLLGNGYGSRKLYILDDDDVVLARLALSEYIKKVEKVVLSSSFKQQEQEQQ